MNTNSPAPSDVEARRRLLARIQVKRIFSPIPITWDEVEACLPFLNRTDALRFLHGEADDLNRRVLYGELFHWHPGLAVTLAEMTADAAMITSAPESPHDHSVETRPITPAADTLDMASLETLTRSLGQKDSTRVLAAWSRIHPQVTAVAWNAYWGVEVEDKDATEVAARLKLSVVDVQLHAYRISKRLRKELEIIQ